MTRPEQGFETRAIHSGQEPDRATGSVVPAVHLATTFRQSAVGQHQGFEYARSGNPTRQSLEAQLASLERARFG
ncbi:MAG: PLP-dependent transferase, partial [Candidatus Dormiibacterota bacterium]